MSNKIRRLKFRTFSSSEGGLGMVEMIVVIAIISTAFIAILQLSFMEKRAQIVAREEIEAYMLSRESMEAVRSIRDEDWANLSSLTYDTPYYPVINSGVWELASVDPGAINGYSRQIEVSEVLRDVNGDIASAGASDPDTLKVTAYTYWTSAGGQARSASLEAYLTNWQGYR